MGHKGATVFSMSQPSPRGLFAPSNGEWATFQIGSFVLLQNDNFDRTVKSATTPFNEQIKSAKAEPLTTQI